MHVCIRKVEVRRKEEIQTPLDDVASLHLRKPNLLVARVQVTGSQGEKHHLSLFALKELVQHHGGRGIDVFPSFLLLFCDSLKLTYVSFFPV